MPNATSPRFSLRMIPWIGVRYLDGTRRHLGLNDLFQDAHRIAGVSVNNAAERAGVLRFLISATALIARGHGDADWDDLAEDGFDPAVVTNVLDDIDRFLWLAHPDTPFMQETRISEKAALQPIASLTPMAPGGSAKTWWGRPGDGFTPATFTPEHAARALTAAWFYSPAGGGKPPAISYSDGLPVGWKGRGTLRPGTQGIRSFWLGENLAQTLLANVMEEWVYTDTTMPLWAVEGDTTPAAGGLLASTWTGSTFLLDVAGDDVVGYRNAGRRPAGITDPKDESIKALEEEVWRADPTVLLEYVPVKKGKEPTGQTRTMKPLAPGTSGMEYVVAWWLQDKTTGRGAVAQQAGLVEVEHAESLVVRIEGAATSPELSELSWLNVDTRLRDRQRDIVLTELASDFRHHTDALRNAITAALPDTAADTIAPMYGFSRAKQAFAQHTEATLASIIQNRDRGPLTLDESRAIGRAVVAAFDEVVAPFTNPSTIENIAVARHRLATRARFSPSANRHKEAAAA